MSKKNYIIPIFVPHKGCPHNCVFCNQKRITGQKSQHTEKEIDDIISSYIKTIKSNAKSVEVAFFGGSFTAIPIEEQNKYLAVAKKYLNKGNINSIRLSTRPDCINKKIVLNLKEYGVSIVELGVQSMDEDVLLTSQRGHTAKDVIDAVKTLKEEGFTVGIQLMVGLPGDSNEKCIETVKRIVRLKPQISRIYPALVIKDTPMEQMYELGSFTPLGLVETVKICKDMLIILESNNIKVIRIGLQPTNEMQMGEGIVAGPYHPSFRQLVESEIYKDMIEFILERKFTSLNSDVNILVNSEDYSNVLGQKKSNMEYFNWKYPVKFIFSVGNVNKNTICVKNSENYFVLSKEEFYKN